MIDKQERGVENCLLQVIFLFAWLLFSIIRVRDRYRWQCPHSTHSQVDALFNLNETFLQKKNFNNSCKCPKFLAQIEFSPINCTIRHVFRQFADHGWQPFEDDRDTRSQSQNEKGFTCLSLQVLAQSSSLEHQHCPDRMVSFRDYEIFLLFLLLVKFHGSGKCESYSPERRILQCLLPCAISMLDTENVEFIFEL